MAIKIGHARISETGKIFGSAGDQNKKEVCITNYYNLNADCVLRPKSAALAEASAKAVEQACANDNIGYDQYQRNTLHSQAIANNFDLSKIKVKCECDCSSLQHVAAIAGGAHLVYGKNGYTTRTMRAAFAASGDYEVLTDKKYLTSDKYLKRGDIVLKEGSHVFMALENGSGIAESTGTGGKKVKIELNVLQKGAKGEQVKTLQRLLIAFGYDCGSSGVDGSFGNATLAAVKKYQKDNKLSIDGSVGEKTWTSLLK